SALTGAGPWVLPVVARVPAGQAVTTPVAGAVAARIFTGAPIPNGADAVVMQEDVLRDGDVIHLSRRPE
ncbi:MAG: molybdopterin molybdenumtransferase MoeA, partial [Rhodobacteraceae bacterium]|nr:molybdopterin molybdenumtransferase MoeA [Paracoccaceae bacterium]